MNERCQGCGAEVPIDEESSTTPVEVRRKCFYPLCLDCLAGDFYYCPTCKVNVPEERVFRVGDMHVHETVDLEHHEVTFID